MIATAIVNNKTITAASGTLDLAGAVTGAGTMNVQGGATLELDGSVAATQTVAFGAGGGVLDLTNTAGFNGKLSGFAAGSKIDLANFAFSGGPTLSFAENAGNTQGVLTIKDGAQTATITLLGQYVAAGFSTSADSGTGTAISYTPPPAPHSELAANHH